MNRPLTLTDLRHAFVEPTVILAVDRPHAAVALVAIESATGSELLFIVRAPHHRDPWSGNIGFPGGRVAIGETDPRQTAERETREELDLDLSGCEFLGRLDDLYGATLPILVSAFVYAAPSRPVLTPNHEVAKIFWCPLEHLLDPSRHRLESLTWRGTVTPQPVVDLLGAGEPLLWGITYRLLLGLFRRMGIAFDSRRP